MRKIFLLALEIFFSMVVAMGCKQTYPAGGPYYYKSWNSYIAPFEPTGPISIDTAKQLEAYYEAFFNNNGKILRFTKYLNNQIEFTATYSYRSDGTLERGEIIKKNGETTIQNFDMKGNLIRK